MKKTITLSLEEYEKIILENTIINDNKAIITIGNGMYTTFQTILSNDDAVILMTERCNKLEGELDRTLYWWQKRKV